MTSSTEESACVRGQRTVARAAEKTAERGSLRIRTRRCDLTKQRKLHSEARKQFEQAAQEIVRISVEKAKAGSLQHAKWLQQLVELEDARKAQVKAAAKEPAKSLADLLFEELKSRS